VQPSHLSSSSFSFRFLVPGRRSSSSSSSFFSFDRPRLQTLLLLLLLCYRSPPLDEMIKRERDRNRKTSRKPEKSERTQRTRRTHTEGRGRKSRGQERENTQQEISSSFLLLLPFLSPQSAPSFKRPCFWDGSSRKSRTNCLCGNIWDGSLCNDDDGDDRRRRRRRSKENKLRQKRQTTTTKA
jgi:hypothetical protein